MEFNKNDLLIMNNALNEICNGPDAIEEWEFSTRMGVERGEVLSLLEKISGILDN